MKPFKTFYAANRDEWRAWLEKNHQTETEVWLIYYKKTSKRPRVPYDDAVREALCFGWVDSLVKRIDDEKYAQKFTPRKNHAKWSEPNKKRARELIQQGKMTDAGFAVIEKGILDTRQDPNSRQKPRQDIVPEFVEKAFNANKKARANFDNLTPSYRRRYILWITSAKREETQKERLRETVAGLAQSSKLGDTVPEFVEKALKANKKASTNFQNLAPSYRRLYIRWITSAKREETQKKRLAEAIGLLAQNKKLGLK
jgi:uncharacterized protein YdeI (YjbR/CyaY-like superfamily)